MSSSKPRLRAIAVAEPGELALCNGCFYRPGFTCNSDSGPGTLAPARCYNYDGNGLPVIFKEVPSVPIRNPA